MTKRILDTCVDTAAHLVNLYQKSPDEAIAALYRNNEPLLWVLFVEFAIAERCVITKLCRHIEAYRATNISKLIHLDNKISDVIDKTVGTRLSIGQKLDLKQALMLNLRKVDMQV